MLTLDRPPVRIAEQGTFQLPGFIDAKYTIGHDAVLDQSDFLERSDYFAVDIETAGLGRKRYDIKVVTFSTEYHTLVFDPRDPAQYQMLRSFLNSGKQLIFHRSTYDVPPLNAVGLLDIETVSNVWDTLLWARLATPGEHANRGLKNSASQHLGMDISDPLPGILKMLGISKQAWFENTDLDTPSYRSMAVSDAVITARLRVPLHKAAYKQITEDHPFSTFGITGEEAWRLVDREQIINRVTLRRTCKGFRASPEFLDDYQAKVRAPQAERERILTDAGIKPGHGASLMKWLGDRDLVPEDFPRTPKGTAYSADKKNLAFLDHPMARTYLEQKEAEHTNKYLETALDAMGLDGRIHPEVNILAAVTGRMSYSGDWPVHQIPENARGMLRADPGETLTSIDWAQIESVLMMNISGEIGSHSKVLQRYESGEDLFSTIATTIGQARKTTKTIVYGTLFGEGTLKLAYSLGYITAGEVLAIQQLSDAQTPENPEGMYHGKAAEQLGIVGYLKAADIKTEIFNQMPRTALLMDKLRGIAKNYRKVFTVSGRILPIPMGKFRGRWQAQTHKGINFYVQGGAYDILAETVIRADEAGLSDAIYILMHDEIVCETSAAHDIQKIMQTPPERLVYLAKRTPILRTDMATCIGDSWTLPCESCGSEPYTLSHPAGKCAA